MIELTINGKKVQAEPKSTILQAALKHGIYIPHLCWDRRLTPYGGCRLCLVEVQGQRKLLAACSTPVEPGMVVRTETEALRKARRTVLELLLTHHPLDCPICDKAGECELQDLAFKYGPAEGRFKAERKAEPEATAAPLIERNPNRCILCGKCVRVCSEHQGVGAINIIGRGFKAKISPAFEETLDCEFCGQCIDACPVGALGAKPYRFRSRVWFMEDVESICPYCGVGCTTVLSIREGRLIRARGIDGLGLNEGDLCPRGRFGFDFIESEKRLSTPMIRRQGELRPVSWPEALGFLAQRLKEIKDKYGPQGIGALASPRLSMEDNFMLLKFFHQVLESPNVASALGLGYSYQQEALREVFGLEGPVAVGLNDPLKADVLLVVESDLTSTHPVYGLKLLRARRDLEATLIVAEPKQTKLARWASEWLRLRPGSSVAFLNALQWVLLEEGLYHKAVEALEGFQAYREALQEYAPEKAAGLCGLSPQDIRRTALSLGRAREPMVFMTFGASENTKGPGSALALANLAALLGKGPRCLGSPAELANTLGLARLLQHFDNKGLGLREMLYEGGLKALYIMGENPVVTFPNSARVEEVLKSLELLVVQDIMLTPTAELAHVVLPASSWSEKEGTFIGATGLAQRFPQCLPETGLSVADWKILRNLGRMMQAEMGAKDMESLRGEMGSLLEPIAQAPECPPRRLLPVRQELLQEPDAQYPFLLSTGVLMQHSGSLTTISKHLGSVVSDAYLQINPQDAKALGIQEEGFVKLTGRAGTSVFIKAKVTDEVPQGMVFAPAHFPHARVSLLTELSTDHQSPTVAVRIEAA